jgi:MEMO1 family protein
MAAQLCVADPARSEAVADREPLGGIVPHAGWICSGAIAGEVLATIARGVTPDVVVVFGAVHTPFDLDVAALDSHERWLEPGGESPVASDVAVRLRESTDGLFAVDDRFHADEHAVEVELPLIQVVWPAARVLPVEVPPTDDAVAIGRRTAEAVRQCGVARVMYLASSDLTHYGPAYRFAPAGVGPVGLTWAKDNDRRLLDVVTDLRAERVVPDARAHASACGPGAIAAMLAACREHGAARATVLRHANSCETLARVAPQPPDNAVGYAGVVVTT